VGCPLKRREKARPLFEGHYRVPVSIPGALIKRRGPDPPLSPCRINTKSKHPSNGWYGETCPSRRQKRQKRQATYQPHKHTCVCMLLVAGGFERRLPSGGRAAPNEHKAVAVAIRDLDDATAGIFDNLIVTLCSHTEALILGISSLLRGGPGWRKLPCFHMPCMSTLCFRLVAHVLCGPEGPRSIPTSP